MPLPVFLNEMSWLLLVRFGSAVSHLFNAPAYVVGSVLRDEEWKDVDVRAIMPDDMWAAFDLGDPNERRSNPRWLYFCKTYSNYGKATTGLPIDFQLQQKTFAEARFHGLRRLLAPGSV